MACGLGLLTGCPKEKQPELPPALQEGAAPLDLSLTNINGIPFRLSELRGKKLMMHFFATWCYPCLPEVNELNQHYAEIKAAGIELVGVGLDLEGTKTLRPFADSFGLAYPLVVGGPEITEGKTDLGPLRSIPALFLLDRDGRVLGYRVGVGKKDWLAQTLKKAAEGR